MNTHADKTLENKSQAVVNGLPKQQSSGNSTFQFADNRPEAIAQRKLQEMASNSLQVKQFKVYQAMVDNFIAQAIERKENLEEETLQGKFETIKQVEEEELLQAKFATAKREEEKPNNTGLPNQLKAGIENLSGMSMDHVKVHYNSDKPAQLQAYAYAQGSEIHVAPGQEKHLPHEAWHVVQQAQGRVKPTLQMKGDVGAINSGGPSVIFGLINPASNFVAGNHWPIQRVYGDSGTGIWLNLSKTGKKDGIQDILLHKKTNTEYVVTSVIDDLHVNVSIYASSSSVAMNTLDEFESDDDSDYEGINTVAIHGLKKADKENHVANSAPRHLKISTNELEKHAAQIHLSAGGDNRLTIVCAQFLTSDADYIRIVFGNQVLIPPAGRASAEALGYMSFRGTQTHAEANMLTYELKHSKDLKYEGHGCDKAACKQCESLLMHSHGNVDLGGKGATGNYTNTYYNSGLSSLASADVQANLVAHIHKNYGQDGNKF